MPLRVAHVTSEAVPFAKTGGLADVLGALPPAQAAGGVDVTVVLPAYRLAPDDRPPGSPDGTVTALGMSADVRRTEHQGVSVLLLDCPPLYARPGLYGVPEGPYPDNAIRFAFLARAAIATLAARGGADIVHVHDWQAALVPTLLRNDPASARLLPGCRTVLTIHNLAYQGVFDPWILAPCGIPAALFALPQLEFFGRVNLLKGGIVNADLLTTVSPTYANEILTPELGCGLAGVLGERAADLHGIVNGIDTEAWDPGTDALLPRRYGASSVAGGKRAARRALAESTGVPDDDRPIAGVVARLAEQKGADLLAAGLEPILENGFDLVILGTGERRYEELLRAAEAAHPGRVRFLATFDERMAHLIYAAADVFLMPSRYEPCGLGQMIALRYGALPVVHRTGGLADTVPDVSQPDGVGVTFASLTVAAFGAAIQRARELLADGPRHRAVRRLGMSLDFSWTRSAARYRALYDDLLRRKA